MKINKKSSKNHITVHNDIYINKRFQNISKMLPKSSPKPAQMKNGKRRNGLCESVWLSCSQSGASSFTMYSVALHIPRAAFFDKLAASGNVNELDWIALRLALNSVAMCSIAMHMPRAARCARRDQRFAKFHFERALGWTLGLFWAYFGIMEGHWRGGGEPDAGK